MPLRIIILLSFTSINLLIVAVVLLSKGDADGSNGTPLLKTVNTTAVAGPTKSKPVFEERIQTFMAKYCYSCHGEEKQKADFSLHQFKGADALIKHRSTWQEIAKMVRSSEMPPKKGKQPTPDERTFFFEWVEQTLDNVDCAELRHPGRVTIRRLNRVEYNNTVRDLLGITFKPAEDFPDDDVGYGFDHIGDVLSLPPVLMEKYLAAAEKIAETAVGQETGSGGQTHRFAAKQLSGGQGWDNNSRTLTSTGEVSRDVNFPETGEYEITINAYEKHAGDEFARMGLTVDNNKLFVFEVKANSKSPSDYKFTARINKGKRRVGGHFLNDYYNPSSRDPNDRDRNLYIRGMTVRGPIVDRPTGKLNHIFSHWPKDEKDAKDVKRAAFANLQLLARLAYRRPVTDDEVNKLVRFVEMVQAEEGSFKEGMQLAVTAMLVSPHFLFRVEQDPIESDPDGIRLLNDHELASRLSYFLWSSQPDAELSKLADSGKLRDPVVLARQIDSMLNDPKASAIVQNFAGQWLQLRSLDRVKPDSKKFATFNEDLKDAMRRETELFFKAIMTEDRSILDFIDAPFTYVNERLAKHYGLIGVKGDTFRKVDVVATQRGGILTQASILTITSNATRTNPVLRGKYVLENILGTPPPPAPPDVPELEEGEGAELKGSLRQRMVQHRENPVCASCHQRMDPIGFGLENYDAIGRWRTKDGKHAIDPSGKLPSGETFKTPADLKSIIRNKKELFARNLAQKMLTYALGRGLEYYDKCAVDDIVAAMRRNDYRFSSMIVAIVQSEPFQKRARMLPDDSDGQ